MEANWVQEPDGTKHGNVWIDFWFSSIAMPRSQGSHWVSTEQIPAR